GLTSMATSSTVFAATLSGYFGAVRWLGWAEPWMVVIAFVGLISLINFIGIRESMWVNWVCTFVEVGGLVFVIVVGLRWWGSVDYLETPGSPAGEGFAGLDLPLLASGAVLTFFAFVGFEDMLNVAEEVERPERTMPIGIVAALGVATLLYLAIAVTAVSVVD